VHAGHRLDTRGQLLTCAGGVDAFRIPDRRLSDDDRAKLMGGAPSRIYWSPPKA
jgi:hypothetical protein